MKRAKAKTIKIIGYIAAIIAVLLVSLFAFFPITLGLITSLFMKVHKTPPSTKSFLGRNDLPRGIRNNNPGNIRLTKTVWRGSVPREQQTDKSFVQFQNIVMGLRAMMHDIIGDIARDKTNTIAKLIEEYAPRNENDTTGYIAQVQRMTGIHKDAQLTPTRTELFKIIRAKLVVENGANAASLISDAEIYEAMEQISPQMQRLLKP